MIPVPSSQHVSSGSLSLVVHGLFIAALVFGLSWKTLPQIPVEADLWQALPAPPPPPLAEPRPITPPPVAKPTEADIALEKAKKQKLAEEIKRKQEERIQAQEKAKAEQERLEQERVEKAKAEQERLEKQRQLKEQQEKERLEKERREAARRQLEQELASEMHDQMDAESPQLKAVQDRVRAAQQTRMVKDFRDRIMSKVKGNVHLPPTLAGNPQAEFQVTLLPNGEVLRVTLTKSSGQRLYDQEVERAILKSSPLPLPADKAAAAIFRDGLALKFRPSD